MPSAFGRVGSLTVVGLALVFCGGERARTPPPDVPASPAVPTSQALAGAAAAPGARATTVEPQLTDARFASVDDVVADALAANKMPGAVVVVGSHDAVYFRRAYGSRSLLPTRAPMTLDTVFDLASLTKPIATATSVLVLVERGALGLDDPASKYVPELARADKASITVRQLLTHTAGFPAELPIKDCGQGREALMRRIGEVSLKAAPGQQFLYSDIGFIVLEEIVRKASGQDLAAFSRDAIFARLGMRETGFLPGPALRARCAPTEQRDGEWIQGDVHDPRAFVMGGVAGHAGLFSTASDLTRFAQAMLLKGRGVIEPSTWMQLAARHDVPGAIRALGWDVKSGYSSNRGAGMSPRAIGHGGYTGTALWIDPERDLFVLFLSNRVHPDGHGSVNALAGEIGGIAVRAVDEIRGNAAATWCPPPDHVETGIDVLREEDFARLRGAKVGLVTNVSGRARDGKTTVDLLLAAKDVHLVGLFTPEHGLGADREGRIASATDERTGLPVHSLYDGAGSFAPTDVALGGLDALVFDVQDVGTRFYTYPSTMRRAMQAATAHGVRFVVLDRPNPIDGVDVAGPVLAPQAASGFVNQHPLPVRHGMTMGELAEMFDADLHMGSLLEVVKVRGWRRGDYLDETGLSWTNPSPNLRSVDEALLYPGVGLLEGTNVSVGRGTDTPFEVVGAPFVDGDRLASALSAAGLRGVAFAPITFTPKAAPYKGEACNGVRLTVTSRRDFEPVRVGVAMAMELRAENPSQWHFDDLMKLVADRRVLDAIDQKKSLAEIEAVWTADLAVFKAKREKYLLYPEAGGCDP